MASIFFIGDYIWIFHTSALVFIILPFVDRGLSIIKPKPLFALLVIGMIVNVFYARQVYAIVLNFSDTMMETYGGYLDIDKTGGATFFGMLNRSFMLFPYYYICMNKEIFKQENKKENMDIGYVYYYNNMFWS